ncbi:MAG TPA: TlyA family RNA methyltransferase [Aggregatilineaceae bacterium]|jgi:23S rRNA (cytidine1920-2'-O)/16S rRNA (cytidine1409-2'-O)-methyltransferase|nr:TlyA family RNA methyltransferase [Aggregatilineaceae bacterium]
MAEKVRLDVLLAERGLAPSREAARRMIMAGEVRVEGEVRDKPGLRVARDAGVEVRQAPRFVSRGGEKLAAALATFPVSVEDRVCADVGASTGGFTDCLLQSGAARVYAIDVGYGQLDYRLRSDPRVVVIERTNARYIPALDEPVSLIVVDVSFIPLRYLLPVFRGWLTEVADLIVLIKPQFEAGKGQVGKGGVVRDPEIHRRVLREVLTAARDNGYAVGGVIPSPLQGPAGNVEFLSWLSIGRAAAEMTLDAVVDEAVAASGPAEGTTSLRQEPAEQ